MDRREFVIQTVGAAAAVMNVSHTLPQLYVQGKHPQITPIHYLSATEMARRVRKGDLSPVDLVDAVIQRSEAIHVSINAMIYPDYQRARATALKCTEVIRAGKVDWSRQPLFGVPFTIKNCFRIKGIPTTVGSPKLENDMAKRDAFVVRQMKRAGGIFLGSTNLPFLSIPIETDNPVFGRTNNPHDLDRTCGGSSGGEGAIIAAGGSPLGIGTDGAGSIRYPSCWCGIAGLAPAPRRISYQGLTPIYDERDEMPCHVSIGPMARTVKDLELALPILAKPDKDDEATLQVEPLRDPRRLNLSDLRIAFFTQWKHGRGTPCVEMQTAVTKCASALDRSGAKVEQTRPAFLDWTLDIGDATFLRALPSDDLRQLAKEYGGQDDRLIQILIEWEEAREKQLPPCTVDKLLDDEYPKYRERLREFMTKYDALLLPVHSHPAMKHTTTLASMENADGAGYVYVSSLVDFLPSGTVRVATSIEGLPIGVLVIGSPFREDIVLRILRELEKQFGGWKPPPEANCSAPH